MISKRIATHYPLKVFWSDEDEGYIALVRDLPGCSAWGATEAEALLEAQDATKAWIKAAKSMNRLIPESSVGGTKILEMLV